METDIEVDMEVEDGKLVRLAIRTTAPGGITDTLLRSVALQRLMDEEALKHIKVPDTSLPESERVALVYAQAYELGANPTKMVETILGLPNRNTAKKRVQQARKLGLIRPAKAERMP